MSSGPSIPPAPFSEQPVLVTGVTGYIGARLVPRLLAAGYSVRCLARSPRKLAGRWWSTDPRVSIVEGDLASSDDLHPLIQGCGVAFYLAHTTGSRNGDVAGHDSAAARRFVDSAERAGLARIIYLGWLGETESAAGPGLSSFVQVGRIMQTSRVPTTIFRSSMIIGSGSASFEILRYLVEHLPVMVTPRWVRTKSQPIAVGNVLHYLVASLREPLTVGRTFDIGGPDILSYADLMRIMAEELGLRRRLVIPVPLFVPWLSALWIHLATPVSRDFALSLAKGLRSRVVCRDDEAIQLMPEPLLTARQAIRTALQRLEQNQVESIWSGAGSIPGDDDWLGDNVFVDRREMVINASVDQVFRAVCLVGGTHGWYAVRWLWELRGWLDRLVGGPGLHRGRLNPESLHFGETVDFWRVSAVEPDRRLRLRAEMKLPGEAMLEFTVEPVVPGEDGRAVPSGSRSRLVQTASFVPRGLAGLAYWYAVMPLHACVFSGMLQGIRQTAEDAAAASVQPGGGAVQRT